MSGEFTFGNKSNSTFDFSTSLNFDKFNAFLKELDAEEALNGNNERDHVAKAEAVGKQAQSRASATSQRELRRNPAAEIKSRLPGSLTL